MRSQWQGRMGVTGGWVLSCSCLDVNWIGSFPGHTVIFRLLNSVLCLDKPNHKPVEQQSDPYHHKTSPQHEKDIFNCFPQPAFMRGLVSGGCQKHSLECIFEGPRTGRYRAIW